MLLAAGAMRPSVAHMPALASTLPAHATTMPRARQLVLSAAVASSSSLLASFKSAAADAPPSSPTPPRWKRTLRYPAFALAFVVASYSIVPMLFFAHLSMYAAWIVLCLTHLVRLSMRMLAHRWRGLSMDMADAFADDYRAAVLSGEAPPPEAPAMARMKERQPSCCAGASLSYSGS